jgi:hypothetical protein
MSNVEPDIYHASVMVGTEAQRRREITIWVVGWYVLSNESSFGSGI